MSYLFGMEFEGNAKIHTTKLIKFGTWKNWENHQKKRQTLFFTSYGK